MTHPLYNITGSNQYELKDPDGLESPDNKDTLPPPPQCAPPCKVLEALVEDVGIIRQNVETLTKNQEKFMLELKKIVVALDKGLGVSIS